MTNIPQAHHVEIRAGFCGREVRSSSGAQGATGSADGAEPTCSSAQQRSDVEAISLPA
jgi:hypothetical protein